MKLTCKLFSVLFVFALLVQNILSIAGIHEDDLDEDLIRVLEESRKEYEKVVAEQKRAIKDEAAALQKSQKEYERLLAKEKLEEEEEATVLRESLKEYEKLAAEQKREEEELALVLRKSLSKAGAVKPPVKPEIISKKTVSRPVTTRKAADDDDDASFRAALEASLADFDNVPKNVPLSLNEMLDHYERTYPVYYESLNAVLNDLKPNRWVHIDPNGSCFYNSFFTYVKHLKLFNRSSYLNTLRQLGINDKALMSLNINYSTSFEEVHALLRKLAAKLLELERSEIEPFIDMENYKNDFNVYLENEVLNASAYADHLVVRSFATFFDMQIRIIRFKENNASYAMNIVDPSRTDITESPTKTLDKDKMLGRVTLIYVPEWRDSEERRRDGHYELLI